MTTEDTKANKTATPPASSVEIDTGTTGRVATFNEGTGTTDKADRGLTLDLSGDGVEEVNPLEGSPGAGEDAPPQEGDDKPEDTAEAASEEGDGDYEPLPDYDPSNAEIAAAYDKRFVNAEDGSVNLQAFSTEWYARRAKGEKGFPEGTYAYIKEFHGLSKQAADDIAEGLAAQAEKRTDTFYTAVGGEETYEAAVVWGAKAYTEEQKAKYNALRDKGGPDFETEVLALVARYKTANPTATNTTTTTTARQPLQARRPANAKVDATAGRPSSGTGSPTAEPYSDKGAWQADLKAAGADPKKLAEVRKRLAASPFYTNT